MIMTATNFFEAYLKTISDANLPSQLKARLWANTVLIEGENADSVFFGLHPTETEAIREAVLDIKRLENGVENTK